MPNVPLYRRGQKASKIGSSTVLLRPDGGVGDACFKNQYNHPDMRVFLLTIGTAGDVHPMVGLGVELKRRGHAVTLVTNPLYERLAKQENLQFIPLGTAEDLLSQFQNPDLWDPKRGIEFVFRHGLIPMIAPTYSVLAEQANAGPMAVVATHNMFGARIAQEKLKIPTVTVVLQPAVLRSVYDTPALPGLNFGSAPRWIKRVLYALIDMKLDSILSQDVNAFRKNLGLPPIRRFLKDWYASPDGLLGLFPEWFGPKQLDWPSPMHLSGFPLYDAATMAPLSSEVEAFLAAGEQPVLFTAGTGWHLGQSFFEASIKACTILGCRGILVSKFRDQIPKSLPTNVIHAEYVPFSQILPRSRLLVHHGGIGTTAQVFAAGIPQVIMPMSLDQPDNALRVERLGVGAQILPKAYQAENVARVIRKVLTDPLFAERARSYADRVNGPASIASACDWIEKRWRR
jgi:rhamnosyltransferase subunit B